MLSKNSLRTFIQNLTADLTVDNVGTWDEDVRKKLGAITSAKAENPHQQQQQLQ